MSVGRPFGGIVASGYRRRELLYPKPDPVPGTVPVAGYRTCPCGRRFPLFEGTSGRRPTHCYDHRGTSRRNRLARAARSL